MDLNDPFFKDEIEKLKTNQNNNKKKESKNEQNDSEKKNQAELELLLMDGDDNKAHFNYKKIQEQHENKKKKGKTKNVKKEIAEDNFEVIFYTNKFLLKYIYRNNFTLINLNTLNYFIFYIGQCER